MTEEMKPKYLKLHINPSPSPGKASPPIIEDKFVLDSNIGKDIKMNQAYTFNLRMSKVADINKKGLNLGESAASSSRKHNSPRATRHHNNSMFDQTALNSSM